jgi:diguanylate cyclase (GGDEF)-like protein/PAS domain S-box-containing protein
MAVWRLRRIVEGCTVSRGLWTPTADRCRRSRSRVAGLAGWLIMQARRIAVGYAVLMAACVVWFLWRPQSHVALGVIAVASAGAIVVGVRLYRPRHVGSWLMVAAALVLDAAGRIVFDALPGSWDSLKPWAWVVWVLNLGVLVFLAVGALGLVRSTLRGASAAIDAAIVILGSGLIAGVVIAIPYATVPEVGAVRGAIRSGYALRDVLVLAVAIYLATAVRWSYSLALFLTGFGGFLVYDVAFRVGRLHDERWTGTAISVPWSVFFAGVGGAALVASMTRFDTPLSAHRRDASPLRLGVVAVLALIPSAVLLLGLFREDPWYQPLIVTAATLILILALARIIDVTLQLRRQVRGERVLREAVTDLASARQAPAVVPVLERAVGRLLGPAADYRAALVMDPDPPPAAWRPDPGGDELDQTASLPSGIARRLPSALPTLAIPLNRRTSPSSGPGMEDLDTERRSSAGDGVAGAPTLLVQGDRATLHAMRPRLEVLATQADLALERIRLNEENTRHVSESYFRTLVQNSTDIILIVDDDNRIRYASPSAESVFGALPLRGVSVPTLVQQPDPGTAERFLEQVRAGTVEVADNATDTAAASTGHGDWIVRSDRSPPARVEVSCRDLRADSSIGGLVLTLRNVTQQRLLQQELTYRASHDPLTGLANRLPFFERLDTVGDHATTNAAAAVLYADLDDLKVINDALGHTTGDDVLKAVGERLKTFAATYGGAENSVAARLGGDEFAVLLTSLSASKEADTAASQLLRTLAQPIRIRGHKLTCGASVGVATTDVDADTGQDLLRNADLALYAAKATGKGQWRHYEPWMRSTFMARLEVRSSLERAIDDEALILEYQPIVSLSDGAPVGVEALLRWEHPTRGRLSPDEFIDVAEESGLITPIGEWVLGTATAVAQQWQGDATHDTRPYVSVNASARQFRTPGFISTIDRLLAQSGLPPERLMLEITESLLLRDHDAVWPDLQHLRHSGVRIAIDDFGTGYSALSYLLDVPVDVIKLDRSFVQSMGASARQRELVQRIVGLAEVLDLHVIAEGIETEHERQIAVQIGCDYGQGYLFSQPLPAADVRRWFSRPAEVDIAPGSQSEPA